MQDARKQELLVAAREGDVERILAVLEDLREHNCHEESTFQADLDQVFAVRDVTGTPFLPLHVYLYLYIFAMFRTYFTDETLLHIAAVKGFNHILDALIRHGFPIDSLSSGSTALHRFIIGKKWRYEMSMREEREWQKEGNR
jgi:hypothetical protein